MENDFAITCCYDEPYGVILDYTHITFSTVVCCNVHLTTVKPMYLLKMPSVKPNNRKTH
jgi:hypothetical protein